MQHPRSLVLLAAGVLLCAVGCEDLPPTATDPGTTPVDAAGRAVTSALQSPSPTLPPSPTAAPSVAPPAAVSPTPFPSPTAPPSPIIIVITPTPAPTAGSGTGSLPGTSTGGSGQTTSTTKIPITFVDPASGTDFTRDNVPVTVKASVASDDAITKFQIYYDAALLGETDASATVGSSFAVTDWNPNVVNSTKDTNLTPVPYGNHSLKAVVTTKKGLQDSAYLPFYKPFLFRGWRTDVFYNGSSLAIPPMHVKRNHLRGYGRTDRLFAVMGMTDGPQAEPSIEMLNLNTTSPSWEYRNLGGLTWRDHPGVAGNGDLLYVVGGNVPNGPGYTMTPSVSVYDLFRMSATEAPPLSLPAVPASDMATAVYNGYLYVVGGTTNGVPTGATGNVYRLPLNASGYPTGGPWQLMASLPNGIRRMGGSLVPMGGSLYLLGGEDERGNHSEFVFRYDPTADTWSSAGFLPRGLSHTGAVVMGDEIWLFGGYTNMFPSISDGVVRYRPATGSSSTFSTDVNLPYPLADMGVGVVNGQVYLVGGSTLDSQGAEVPTDAVLRANTL